MVFVELDMSKKDINTLIKLLENLGKSICDLGSYDEQKTKHLIIKWKYKGKNFTHKFPDSLKSTTLNYQYSQLRKNLRAVGLGPPNQSAKSFNSSHEQQDLLCQLWVHLGTDDEGETPYGGDLDK